MWFSVLQNQNFHEAGTHSCKWKNTNVWSGHTVDGMIEPGQKGFWPGLISRGEHTFYFYFHPFLQLPRESPDQVPKATEDFGSDFKKPNKKMLFDYFFKGQNAILYTFCSSSPPPHPSFSLDLKLVVLWPRTESDDLINHFATGKARKANS